MADSTKEETMEKTKTALFEALGEVSAPYWRDAGTVFDSNEATRIGNGVMEVIKTDVPLAIEILREALKDEGYRVGWRANIAMAFKDEYFSKKNFNFPETAKMRVIIHEIANTAAENFLKLLESQPTPAES